MRRLLLLALCLVAVSSAAAADGQQVRGTILVLTDKAVVVKSDRGATACARTDASPSLDGYTVGDAVALLCARNHGGRLVLVKAQHATPPASDTKPVTFGGAITALSADSISLHDGNHDLTCSIGAASPSTSGLKVGQHVKVACVGGVLAKLVAAADGPQPPAGTDAKTAAGSITALTATSLTIHNDEHGDVTCTLGASSPSLGDYKVGDRVGLACVGGVLAKIVKVDAAPQPQPPAPAPELKTAAGNITALTATSLSIHNDEHGGFDVTCTIGPSSPRLGDYAVGDRVGIACAGGVLAKIVKIAS